MVQQQKPSPEIQLPEYQFSGGPSDAEKPPLLIEFDQHLSQDPAALASALSVYAAHAEATGRVLEFVDSHPDSGLTVLRFIKNVMDDGIDKEIDFDEKTETAIGEDKIIKTAIEKVREGGPEGEAANWRVRTLRLGKFLNRRANAQHARSKAGRANDTAA